MYENHGFVCLPGVSIEGKPYFEEGVPFPWYKIPNDLPFSVIVKTDEGHTYNLNVLETARRQGCKIDYTALVEPVKSGDGNQKAEAEPKFLLDQKSIQTVTFKKDMPLKEALKSRLLSVIRENADKLEEGQGGCTLWQKREWVQSLLEQAD